MSEQNKNQAMNIKFWGARGSRPVCGIEFLKYGGDTTCVEVSVGKNVLVFDMGSGFNAFSDDFQKRAEAGTVHSQLEIFSSHFHFDHVVGLEQAPLMFDRSVKKTLHAGEFARVADEITLVKTAYQLHADLFHAPYSPRLGELHCQIGKLNFQDHVYGKSVEVGAGDELVRVTPFAIPHGRDLSVGFRIEAGSACACILTDLGYNSDPEGKPVFEKDIIEHIRGADILIADSMYEEFEFVQQPFLKNFGHASREIVLDYAKRANIPRVIHAHHNPRNNDVVLRMREEVNAAEAALMRIDAHFAKEGESLVAAIN